MAILPPFAARHPLVVVVGSINMDYTITTPRIPLLGETIMGKHSFHQGGGKGANAAIAAACCGAQTYLIAAFGDDHNGTGLYKELRQYHVDTTYCSIISHHPTGSAFITVDTKGNNTVVVAPGANAFLSPESTVAAIEAIRDQYPHRACCLAISTEIPFPTIMHCLEYGKAHHTPTVFNPAPVIPEVITQLPQHSWPSMILTPNERECLLIAAILGKHTDNHTIAARFIAEQLSVPVITTLGVQGALITQVHEPEIHVPAQIIDTIDTVSAGDTFNGYLATAISEGHDMYTACSWATRGAAIACTYHGARPEPPSLDDALL